jgi:hypothetical protein
MHLNNTMYGIPEILLNDLEDLLQDLIMSEEALFQFLCPFCHRATVHRLFRENGDGSYDEVGLRCRKCKHTL